MWPPPLLRDRPFAVRIVLAVALPVLFGALSGFVVGESALGFNVLMVLGAPGGISAGFEHAGWRGGFVRGMSGGVLFAGALVVVHAARGVPVMADLPAPLTTMAVFYALMGIPLGTLGGWLRGRLDARAAKLRAAHVALK